jgi:NAD-dependent deacetylase
MLRPDVVWFGEMLPSDALEAATNAARNCDLFLSIGTSGHVEPAASLPYWALQNGATVAVINLDVTTRLETPDLHKLRGPAGQILPALLLAAWPDSSV